MLHFTLKLCGSIGWKSRITFCRQQTIIYSLINKLLTIVHSAFITGCLFRIAELITMKDSTAVIVASGAAGLMGGFFPAAQGWVLDQSLTIMGTELSAQSFGLFAVSRLLFLPALVLTIVGGVAMARPQLANRATGVLCILASLGTLIAWYLQKAAIDQFSVVGIGPSLGLFLLLVSGLGGLVGGLLLTVFPHNEG